MISTMNNMIILTTSILISIAFFTLMERKLISLSQNRKGPNKSTMIGITQPIADAMKLMTKEITKMMKTNKLMFIIFPIMNIMTSLTMWMITPMMFTFNFMKMSLIFMISCMCMNTVSIMMMAWSSNSNYSFISMMRTIAQMISYEINMILIMMVMMNTATQMNLTMMQKTQKYMPMAMVIPMVMLIWLILILAETNRTPFDFSEGESELISGFNIEYSSESFMFLFLAEYSSILIMSMVSMIMFTKMTMSLTNMIIYLSICFFFVWARTTLPRFRYDKLMELNWIQLMPTTTLMFFISFTMKTY